MRACGQRKLFACASRTRLGESGAWRYAGCTGHVSAAAVGAPRVLAGQRYARGHAGICRSRRSSRRPTCTSAASVGSQRGLARCSGRSGSEVVPEPARSIAAWPGASSATASRSCSRSGARGRPDDESGPRCCQCTPIRRRVVIGPSRRRGGFTSMLPFQLRSKTSTWACPGPRPTRTSAQAVRTALKRLRGQVYEESREVESLARRCSSWGRAPGLAAFGFFFALPLSLPLARSPILGLPWIGAGGPAKTRCDQTGRTTRGQRRDYSRSRAK
jgi:hypothetical protein